MARPLSIEATCHLIDALLTRGYPALDELAQLLGVSSRTFQRQLNGEGVTYSGLVERCRRKSACKALEHTQRPIQDISAALGYADASSFARAFRRWTGLSPRVYRNKSRGQQTNWRSVFLTGSSETMTDRRSDLAGNGQPGGPELL